jgi:hypothetical protein
MRRSILVGAGSDNFHLAGEHNEAHQNYNDTKKRSHHSVDPALIEQENSHRRPKRNYDQ